MALRRSRKAYITTITTSTTTTTTTIIIAWFPQSIDQCWCIFVMLRVGLRLSLGTLTFTFFVTLSSIYSITFLSIHAVQRSAAFWSNPMLTVVPAFFRFFSRLFGTVPSAPITIGIILVFTFQSLLSSRARIRYLSTQSLLFYLQTLHIYQKCRLVEVVVLLYDYTIIIRSHRSTTYVRCYRPISMVCRSVGMSICLSVCLFACHTSEPCKIGGADRDAVWVEDSGGPSEPCIRWAFRSPPSERAINFLGGKGRPIVKYRDTMLSVQKRLNRSRCRLGCGLGWAAGIMC